MLEMVIAILLGWNEVFARERTAKRAIRQALSSACVLGRRTIARSILVREQEGEGAGEEKAKDWSADYRLHSRSPWEAQDLFDPILKRAIARSEGELLALATDDTQFKKSGKKIATARFGRDPMSPPFHVNLRLGIRFLHTSVLLPLHDTDGVSARAIPVWFEEVPSVKKPGTKASDEERAAYRKAKKERNLSTEAVEMFKAVRKKVDEAGGADKTLAFGLDGSFTNRTTFRAALERTHLIGRVRKDAKLCFRSAEKRRVYATTSFTPESVLKDGEVAWQEARIFHGGAWRQVQYKQLDHVLWRGGAGKRELRLLVVKPTPYRLTKKGRMLWREPAFLLCTKTEGEATPWLQVYFDRLHIEVAHRELKDTFGVAEAQVRNPLAVPRQPALSVATYSALHLASLEAFGARRNEALGPLPRWQREKTRASCQELIRYLRHEVVTHPEVLAPFGLSITEKSLLAAATT